MSTLTRATSRSMCELVRCTGRYTILASEYVSTHWYWYSGGVLRMSEVPRRPVVLLYVRNVILVGDL